MKIAREKLITLLEKAGINSGEIDELLSQFLQEEAQDFIYGIKEAEELCVKEDVFKYKTDAEFSAKVDNLIDDLKTKKEGNK